MATDYNPEGIAAIAGTGRPIPGQSLTNDPNQSYPWEGPPEFTNFRDALHYITEGLLEEDIYVPLMQGIGGGVPLTDIALQLLQRGFQEGKWNPDLLMMLIEPTIYVLMALAEKAGIEYRINGDEEEDLDQEDENDIAEMRKNNLAKYAKEKVEDTKGVPEGALPADIIQKVESLEMPDSLLDRPAPVETTSLLERGEG